MKKRKLTGKQKRFCQEYVIDFNATQAAIRAGYSKRTARSQGQRMLTNVDIQNFITNSRKKTSEKLEITHQETLKKLSKWVDSDITEVLGLTLDEIKALPLDVKQLISEVNHSRKSYMAGDVPVTEDVFKFKFVSKERAVDMINRHTGFYEKDNTQQANNIIIFDLPNNGRG